MSLSTVTGFNTDLIPPTAMIIRVGNAISINNVIGLRNFSNAFFLCYNNNNDNDMDYRYKDNINIYSNSNNNSHHSHHSHYSHNSNNNNNHTMLIL